LPVYQINIVYSKGGHRGTFTAL